VKVSDFVVNRLHQWGVRRIFGYPGDGINGVLGGLQRAGTIEFVQVRHEEMAAFMAVAHAKFTGEIGVCLSTGGPGATHMITGLYDGKLDHAPVLAICGQAEATVRGSNYQQELNLDRMFADVADFVQEASAPAQVRHLIDRGIRIAKAGNGAMVKRLHLGRAAESGILAARLAETGFEGPDTILEAEPAIVLGLAAGAISYDESLSGARVHGDARVLTTVLTGAQA